MALSTTFGVDPNNLYKTLPFQYGQPAVNPGGEGAPLPGATAVAKPQPMPVGMVDMPAAPAPASSVGYMPSSYTSTKYTSTGYEAKPYEVPEDGLVQNRVLDIAGKNSPLMQAARTRALQDMNARGMVNSSIATGAGEAAVIDKALQIATPDAAAYNAAALKTGDAENTARQFGAAAENTALTNTANQENAASQFGATARNKAEEFQAGAANASALQAQQSQSAAFLAGINNAAQLANTKLSSDTQIALANLDAATKLQLTNIDTQSKQLLQSNTSASQAYVQAATNIANIASSTMSEEAKRDATQTQINMLRQQLDLIGGVASAEIVAQLQDLGKQYYGQDNTSGGTVGPGASNVGTNGSIPTGGSRDANGNVYNADGTPAGWRGPSGMPVAPGQGAAGGGGGQPAAPNNTPIPAGGYRDDAGNVYSMDNEGNPVWVGMGPAGQATR